MTIKISVIMPVYNVEAYLHQSIDSVLNQTMKDFELICVNDGSTDDSAKILEEYAQKDSRIKIITQANAGQSVARNKALRIATGEYISFIDSDDVVSPVFLEVLHNAAEKSKCPVVCCGFAKFKKKASLFEKINSKDIKYKVFSNPLKHLLKHLNFSSVIWNKLYRADIIKNHFFIEGICFEDWPWITCLFAKLQSYATVPYSLYGYNIGRKSTMRSSFTVDKLKSYEKGIIRVYDYFQQPECISLWKYVRHKRIAASVKMMINKTYHERKGQPELDKNLLKTIKELVLSQKIKYIDLPLKVIFRLMCIKHRS